MDRVISLFVIVSNQGLEYLIVIGFGLDTGSKKLNLSILRQLRFLKKIVNAFHFIY